MVFRVMGVIEYFNERGRMLKIIGRTNTVTTSCEIEHPGGKIGIQEVIDVIAAGMHVDEENIRIPLHIKERLK